MGAACWGLGPGLGNASAAGKTRLWYFHALVTLGLSVFVKAHAQKSLRRGDNPTRENSIYSAPQDASSPRGPSRRLLCFVSLLHHVLHLSQDTPYPWAWHWSKEPPRPEVHAARYPQNPKEEKTLRGSAGSKRMCSV